MATLNYTLEDVGPYKSVNGEEVLMTDEERQALADEWNENASRVVVPSRVPMRKARRALRAAGLLSLVDQSLAAIPGAAGDDARDDWEYSSEVHRDNPTLQALASMLGLTDEQLDQLFLTADSYP